MIGIGIGRKRKNWSPKNNSDLWVKSRSGLTLVDEYGNNPVLLMPVLKTNGTSTYTDTGITAVVNTIWVIKCKIVSTAATKWQGSQNTGQNTRFFFGTGISSTNKINFGWGDKTAQTVNDTVNDFDYHVFIMYDKRMWIVDKNTTITDSSILNIINTVTPTINLSTATWSGTEESIRYGSIKLPYYISSELAYSYIGTITDNEITWQAKHVFGGIITYSYDIINGDIITWNDAVNLVKLYSQYGSSHFIDVGYSLYMDTNGGGLKKLIPYLENGQPNITATIPSGYSLFKNYSDNRLFINDCKVRFTNIFFDRSDVTIYNNNARGTNYDSSNKKDWYGFELNRFVFENFINSDYKYMPFIKYNIKDEENYPIEIILTKTNLLLNKNSIFNYCNDYDISITVTQLSYHIDSQNGNKIFGYDPVAKNIFYSADNGINFTTIAFADADDIGMSYVFNNGNILFGTNEKFYRSTDGLETIEEINIYDQNKNAFPIVSGIKNFVNVRFVDNQILNNGKQLITFGAYINVVPGPDGYVCLFYSIEGENVGTVYMFGQNPDYSNLGDPLNSIIARHVHSSTYSPITGKWYWNTGDHGATPNFECHFCESTYNYLTDTWSTIILLSGDATSHIKSGALLQYNGIVYFGSDATELNGSINDKGVFKVEEGDLGTYASHVRLFNHLSWIIGGHVVLKGMGVAFASGIPYDAGKFKFFTYSKYLPFVYNLNEFEQTPAQTTPDTYVAWKLIKVSDSVVLANTMRVTDSMYIYNTIKITRN